MRSTALKRSVGLRPSRRSRPRIPYPPGRDSQCWFRYLDLPDAGECRGGLVRCHLIDKRLLRREFPDGHDGCSLEELQADPRCWRWGCGGLSGLEGHHGMFDGKRLGLPRAFVPAVTEMMAVELGIVWWLDRTYGERNV